jgi:hypothetical protein
MPPSETARKTSVHPERDHGTAQRISAVRALATVPGASGA